MTDIGRTFGTIAVLLTAVTCGCSSDAGTDANQGSDSLTTTQGDHQDEGGEHAREGRSEHDRDGDGHHGEEGEESGTEFGLDDTYDETRHGARLVLAYDAEGSSFQGTVENTTDETLKRVRVEVHLSNGRELGPTTPADLKPGEKREVKLTAESEGFDGWSAHPEVGNREHGHGEGRGEHGREGRGEHDRDGGEHDRESQGEHGEKHKDGDSD